MPSMDFANTPITVITNLTLGASAGRGSLGSDWNVAIAAAGYEFRSTQVWSPVVPRWLQL
ncbi:hypothetical protein PI124_g4278 [Phytophthora idaei]|nr:hypothetical protein PI125_g3411 [Phytophthora idaei]KAG3164474.1 hypothetical protein PI126_g5082 [Phytophthora idaei]KAG3251113.1 hypothetical protein PI124_g4278 [Phytophthora idaei]